MIVISSVQPNEVNSNREQIFDKSTNYQISNISKLMTSLNSTHIHSYKHVKNKCITKNATKNARIFILFYFKYIFLSYCRLFEFRKIISNRASAYNLIPYDYPVEIIKVRFLNFLFLF